MMNKESKKNYIEEMKKVFSSSEAVMIAQYQGLNVNELDELRKQYVITARAKGVDETKLLFRYPVRLAINPLISTVGWLLPAIVSGEVITAIVLNLPTTGPMLLRALQFQDTYFAGSIVLFLGGLTVIGTFLSDLALVWIDPRIRFERN